MQWKKFRLFIKNKYALLLTKMLKISKGNNRSYWNNTNPASKVVAAAVVSWCDWQWTGEKPKVLGNKNTIDVKISFSCVCVNERCLVNGTAPLL